MLANAANDGIALAQAPLAVRRRAVLEKGLRPFFHGGWMSALCIDMRYDDSRSEDEQAWARIAAVAARDPDDPLGENEVPDISFTMAEDGMEVSKGCGVRLDGGGGTDAACFHVVQMKFRDPLEIREWKDDPRLRDFEDAFFEEGGVLNAKGF